jgi:hypothetical protein
MLSKLRPTTVLRRLLTAAAPHQQAIHAKAGARSHLLMRSTMMQSQQMRMFTTDNEKTIDITKASEEAEPIIT